VHDALDFLLVVDDVSPIGSERQNTEDHELAEETPFACHFFFSLLEV